MTNLPKPNRRMLDIAETIIEQHAGTFDPSSFKDRYEDAVRDLIAHKQRGRKVTTAPPPAQAEGNVVDLMEALRRSLAGHGGGSNERVERFLERKKGKTVAKARPRRKTRAA
jgi:DNA end-binding protein Ku